MRHQERQNHPAAAALGLPSELHFAPWRFASPPNETDTGGTAQLAPEDLEPEWCLVEWLEPHQKTDKGKTFLAKARAWVKSCDVMMHPHWGHVCQAQEGPSGRRTAHWRLIFSSISPSSLPCLYRPWGKRPLGGKHQDVVPGLWVLSPSRVPWDRHLYPWMPWVTWSQWLSLFRLDQR